MLEEPARGGKKPKGIIHIKSERCKGCGYCIEFCPFKCLVFSNGFNSKGYHPPEVVKPEACTGCLLCERLCPDYAIFITLQKL